MLQEIYFLSLTITDVLLRKRSLYQQHRRHQIVAFGSISTHFQGRDNALDLQYLDRAHCIVGTHLQLPSLVSMYALLSSDPVQHLTLTGFPPQGYWDRDKYPNAHCYGFGFGDEKEFIGVFESHTALNMAFDLTVFITPMVLFTKPNLRMKNIFAMSGIFVLGGM